MSNLQKFNEILEEFNQEVGQLKEVSGAYKKLQHLTDTYNVISKQFDENSKTVDKINKLQKAQQEKVAQSLIELENSNKQNKTELAKLVEEKTDQIRKENKDFYKDIETNVKIKLDETKSQIKELIENERNIVTHILKRELDKNAKSIDDVNAEINKYKNLIDQCKNNIHTLIIIVSVFLILSVFAIFFHKTT